MRGLAVAIASARAASGISRVRSHCRGGRRDADRHERRNVKKEGIVSSFSLFFLLERSKAIALYSCSCRSGDARRKKAERESMRAPPPLQPMIYKNKIKT